MQLMLPGLTAKEALEKLTWEAVPNRYREELPEDVEKILKHELAPIARLGYAPYFLTVNSIVRSARSKDILCQGRGSAANSRHHFDRSVAQRPGVRALRFGRKARAARHRCRL
jgi:error-prone DNA polymerase